jgi:hypothetical protein
VFTSIFISPQVSTWTYVEIKQEPLNQEVEPSTFKTSDSKGFRTARKNRSKAPSNRGRPRKTDEEYDREIKEAIRIAKENNDKSKATLRRISVLKNNRSSQKTRDKQKEKALKKQNSLEELKKLNAKLHKQFKRNEEIIMNFTKFWTFEFNAFNVEKC